MTGGDGGVTEGNPHGSKGHPNQALCSAGQGLLLSCAGLWAKAQDCHWNPTTWIDSLRERV